MAARFQFVPVRNKGMIEVTTAGGDLLIRSVKADFYANVVNQTAGSPTPLTDQQAAQQVADAFKKLAPTLNFPVVDTGNGYQVQLDEPAPAFDTAKPTAASLKALQDTIAFWNNTKGQNNAFDFTTRFAQAINMLGAGRGSIFGYSLVKAFLRMHSVPLSVNDKTNAQAPTQTIFVNGSPTAILWRYNTDEGVANATPAVNLGHELVHAVKDLQAEPWPHRMVMAWENMLRYEEGVPLRIFYTIENRIVVSGVGQGGYLPVVLPRLWSKA